LFRSKGFEIRRVASGPDLEEVRDLFREYARSLPIDLAFQGFEEELRSMPGAYAPPLGSLLLGRWSGDAAGCVGVRPFEEGVCEMKRLYVRPDHRGHHLGRQLASAAVEEGRSLGYREMRLDTIPSMRTAQELYRSLGFVEMEPYRPNPVPGARFLRRSL